MGREQGTIGCGKILAEIGGGRMKYVCTKEVSAGHSQFSKVTKNSEKSLILENIANVPAGAICDVEMYKNKPCIFYNGIYICDVGSIMQKLNFMEVKE